MARPPPGAPPTTPADKPVKPDVVVTVSKSASALTVTDEGGKVVFFAPVTTGSEHDPLPIGEWKVNGTQFNPTFRYNPELFWDADPTHTKAVIPAGPNNPVGMVWIDLSKGTTGSTARPSRRSSAGASRTAACGSPTGTRCAWPGSVKPGTRVVFTE